KHARMSCLIDLFHLAPPRHIRLADQQIKMEILLFHTWRCLQRLSIGGKSLRLADFWFFFLGLGSSGFYRNRTELVFEPVIGCRARWRWKIVSVAVEHERKVGFALGFEISFKGIFDGTKAFHQVRTATIVGIFG